MSDRRRSGRRTAAAVLLPALLLAAAAGCPRSEAAAGAAVGRFALAQELADFDPLGAWNTVAQVLQRQVYEGLVEYRYGGGLNEFDGLLAESWSVGGDGREWRFRLRPDAAFYDPGPEPLWPGGRRPVRAADVVASLLRLADPRLEAGGWFVLEGLVEGLDELRAAAAAGDPAALAVFDRGGAPDRPAGLRAVDDHTVLLRLARPAPDLLMRLASPYCVVVPAEAWRRTEPALRDHPVGSGPFFLAEWEPRQRAVFRAVPGWRRQADGFGPLPHLDEAVFTAVLEGSTRTLLFERGEIDRLPPAQDSFARLVRDGRPAPELAARGVRLVVTETPDLSMLVLNQ
ncbi:MAG: ABC transporter substrate-binding protein, partial [Planctomycetota bacterium]